MRPPDVGRAIDAAMAIAVTLGLPADGATVLHDSNRLTLRLAPCGVLARVAHADQGSASFEVHLAERLAEVGCPLGTLEPRVEPLVYLEDGFTVTLWTYHEPLASRVRPGDYAAALEQLHIGMRDLDLGIPSFTVRVAQARMLVTDPELTPELAEVDRETLRATMERLCRSVGAVGVRQQPLHGEPHPGNLLNTADGPLFVDLETCCRGPIEFDLAHVPETVSLHYPDVDQGVLDDCRQLVLAMVAAWRWDRRDDFPDGRSAGEALLEALRDGPPWPTLDAVMGGQGRPR